MHENIQPSEVHNPDRLIDEQVGVKDGWRLLYKDEVFRSAPTVQTNDIQMWAFDGPYWNGNLNFCGDCIDRTYRTQLTRAELRKARGLEPEEPSSQGTPENEKEKPKSLFTEILKHSNNWFEAVMCMENAYNHVENALAAARAEATKLTEERDAARAEVEKAMEKLRHEMGPDATDGCRLYECVELICSQRDNARGETNFIQAALSSEITKVDSLRSELTAANARADKAERERDDLQAVRDAVTESGKQASLAAGQALRERDEARAQLAEAQARVQELERDLLQINPDRIEEQRDDALAKLTASKSRVKELEARLAVIDAGVKADADDPAKMRDGTKLTRAGLVEIIMEQRKRMKELEAECGRMREALNIALRASDPDEDWEAIASVIQAALSPNPEAKEEGK